MGRRWVINASPLIVLAKAGLVDVLHRLADLEIPAAVRNEILAAGPQDPAAAWLTSSAGRVIPEEGHDPRVLAWDLGAGETAVLTHALRTKEESRRR